MIHKQTEMKKKQQNKLTMNNVNHEGMAISSPSTSVDAAEKIVEGSIG